VNATSRRTHSRGIAPIDATGYRKGFNYCPKVADEGQEGVALVTFDFAKLQPVITELQLSPSYNMMTFVKGGTAWRGDERRGGHS